MLRVVALLMVLLAPFAAIAGNVALVIGNSDYGAVSELPNPRNDSRAIADALGQQGFEVTLAQDLDRTGMYDTLRAFRDSADGADMAVVYYAGHGLEIAGINYLVPVDAELEDERDASVELVSVDVVLRQISGARSMKMVVLDACRNNPFIDRMQRAERGRNVGQGLAIVNAAVADTLIAYAAAAGEITPDGAEGGNSPFTAAFLNALAGPPADVRRLLGAVRDEMRLSVPGAAPFVYSSLGGGEYVINPMSARPAPVSVPAVQPPAPTPVPADTDASALMLDYVLADRAGTIEAWDDFLVRHQSSRTHILYLQALEKRLGLERQVLASRTPEPVAAPSGPPAAQTPAVPVPASPAAASPVPTLTAEAAARDLQGELKARNCYSGPLDGDFGRNSINGLRRFAEAAGREITLSRYPSAEALLAALAVVRDNPSVTCPVVAASRTSRPPKTAQPAAPAPQAGASVSGATPPPANSGAYPNSGESDVGWGSCDVKKKGFYSRRCNN